MTAGWQVTLALTGPGEFGLPAEALAAELEAQGGTSAHITSSTGHAHVSLQVQADSAAAAWTIALVTLNRAGAASGSPRWPLDEIHITRMAASDEDRIREAMTEAQDHPGRVITR